MSNLAVVLNMEEYSNIKSSLDLAKRNLDMKIFKQDNPNDPLTNLLNNSINHITHIEKVLESAESLTVWGCDDD